jgi:hypothetical protein
MLLQEVVTRIRMEYVEMPDMKLTFAQARRLWDLPIDLCEAALAALVANGFLEQSADGRFLRTRAQHARSRELTV